MMETNNITAKTNILEIIKPTTMNIKPAKVNNNNNNKNKQTKTMHNSLPAVIKKSQFIKI